MDKVKCFNCSYVACEDNRPDLPYTHLYCVKGHGDFRSEADLELEIECEDYEQLIVLDALR